MRALLGIFLCFTTLSVFASPAEEREESRIPILDTAEEFFGHRVNHLANDFDSFFATDRADDELGRSRVRIRYNYQVEERALPQDDMQFRFNLKLPHLEQKFQFNEGDKKQKDAKTAADKKREDQLKKVNSVDERWLFNATGNANVSIHPHITLQGRLRKSKETGTIIHRFVQEATWRSNADGFRHRTLLTSDHSIKQTLLFRFGNTIDWKISQKTFATGHGPVLLHRISDFEAMSYAMTVGTTVEEGILFVSNYQLAPTYRRNLYKDILYFDITPGINFPKTWSFRRTPFIFAQLEMLFGSN